MIHGHISPQQISWHFSLYFPEFMGRGCVSSHWDRTLFEPLNLWLHATPFLSKKSNRACAVELLSGVVAQFSACSSVRTGIVFTALGTCYCMVDLRMHCSP